MNILLPMDYACLQYLIDHGDGGSMPTVAIPSRLFAGEIPQCTPSLVALGLIEHRGGWTTITPTGRRALTSAYGTSND